MDWIGTALGIGAKLIDRIPDPAAKEKAELEMRASLLAALVEESKGQAEINKVEAAHSSLFVAGWRPAIGWACAIGFGWTFVGLPLFSWLFALVGVTTPLPTIDHSILMELTFGMLGMGALRSFDKWKGKSK
jgi:hypothetical protein